MGNRIKNLVAFAVSGLAALLVSTSVHAFALYRVDFTAVIDDAWYSNDPTIDSNCAVSYDNNNCIWTDVIGTTANGYWIFEPIHLGTDKYPLLKYDVVIPAAYGGSWYVGTGGEQTEPYTLMTESRWNAGLATDRFGATRSSVVDIRPGAPLGDVPDLATADSQFYFSAQAVRSDGIGPFVCPFNDTSIRFPNNPTLYGACGGEGHLTSISVTQVGGQVNEPATLALVGAALLGITATRRRRLKY